VSIYNLLKGALAENAGVSSIVSTRIYPLKLPQNPTYEAISYQRISNTGQDGTSTLRQSRWQINCWAAGYVDAQALATAVKDALEEYVAISETPGINMARVVNELDDWDEESDVYRVMIDVILHTTGD
jgi:hypothetical protein